MSEKVLLPTYTAIRDALDRLNAIGEAAEIHGLLSAFVTVGVKVREQAWVNSLQTRQVEKGDLMAGESRNFLVQLYQATQTQFSAEEDAPGFALLLPADDENIHVRIDAMRQWCQGFLSGLNLTKVSVENHPEESIKDALNDLTQIAMMEPTDEETGDPDSESDWQSLKTYVAQCVSLIADYYRKLQQEAEQEVKH